MVALTPVLITYFTSLSHLFPAITIGTFGKFFFERPDEPDMALNLVSNICSLNRITSSNDSLESMLKHSTKRSPKIWRKRHFLIHFGNNNEIMNTITHKKPTKNNNNELRNEIVELQCAAIKKTLFHCYCSMKIWRYSNWFIFPVDKDDVDINAGQMNT